MVNSCQYDFIAGRGTEDAIDYLIDEARNFPYKYVMGVFLDIFAVFNNARWHQMLEKVERATDGSVFVTAVPRIFLGQNSHR